MITQLVLTAIAQTPSTILSQTVPPTIGPSVATGDKCTQLAAKLSATLPIALTPDEHACLAAQLGSLLGSSAQLDSLAQLDTQLDPLVQPGSLSSLALLGWTSLAPTQLGSLQGATALPDLMTQHASLMQRDVLPLTHASLTSMATTRSTRYSAALAPLAYYS